MRAVTALLGVLALLAAVLLAMAGVDASPDDPLVIATVTFLAIFAFIGVLIKIGGSGGDDVAPAPWSDDGALVADAPERSPAEYDISGDALATVVESAGETSRDEGTVEAGVEVVRPHLREALLGAMVQGGYDRAAAERSLARGDWTDDETAAAVLDENVDRPAWGFLRRLEAWLFPERVLRGQVKRAMQAVAATADDHLPTVPGQHAPRTVPVVRPTLEDLRRGADGHLQRAANPLSARRGSPVDGGTTVYDAETVNDDGAADDGPDGSGADQTAADDADADSVLDESASGEESTTVGTVDESDETEGNSDGTDEESGGLRIGDGTFGGVNDR